MAARKQTGSRRKSAVADPPDARRRALPGRVRPADEGRRPDRTAARRALPGGGQAPWPQQDPLPPRHAALRCPRIGAHGVGRCKARRAADEASVTEDPMAEVVFYTNPQSRGAMTHWMLEEIGCPYRIEVMQFGPAMKSPAYLAINPMGKVPAIKHGDTVVTETGAILCYLADLFPEARLAPPPDDRGAYYRWLFFVAGCCEPALGNKAAGWNPTPELQGRFG